MLAAAGLAPGHAGSGQQQPAPPTELLNQRGQRARVGDVMIYLQISAGWVSGGWGQTLFSGAQ